MPTAERFSPSDYGRLVEALPMGKRLPDAVYVHASALAELPRAAWPFVERARVLAGIEHSEFDVLKFSRSEPKISLLAYPTFFEDGFPALRKGWVVDLDKKTVQPRAYGEDGNPPILHRKELLLPEEHPARPDFEALTRSVEAYGLFENPREIGTLVPWQARLDRLRLSVCEHRLVERDDEDASGGVEIQRSRTALTRYGLSSPARALWRHGYLEPGRSFFDYGCGRGDDVRILQGLGVESSGWDPNFAPGKERHPSETVNIGFVLNVIEDRQERVDALLGAWRLTKRVLAVAAIVGERSQYERHRLYRDGVVTARGTFQKFFTQRELRDFLGAVLERAPIAVGAGLFFVFRGADDEQAFLDSRLAPRRPAPPPCAAYREEQQALRVPRARKPSPWQLHAELLESFWQTTVLLGRPPEDDEFDRLGELEAAFRSRKSVYGRLLRERGAAELQSAQESRRTDLTVQFALDTFERRSRLRDLPTRLQRDIRALWSSHGDAMTAGRNLLFASGASERLIAEGELALAAGVGAIDDRGHLNLHVSQIPLLGPCLRVVIGCAERIYGDVESFDLVRVHLRSKKVTLLQFDGFEREPLPRLRRRVKVILAKGDFLEFDRKPDAPISLLYSKSRYIPASFPRFDEQKQFDEAIAALALRDDPRWPHSEDALGAALAERALRVRGFRLVRMIKERSSKRQTERVDPGTPNDQPVSSVRA